MDETLEALYLAEGDLMVRAFLYEHPSSFRDGVEASMEAVRAMLTLAPGGSPFEPHRGRAPAVEGGSG